MKLLKPKDFILKVLVTNGTESHYEYVSRVTESTILTIKNEREEVQYRAKDGIRRGDNKWAIEDTSHSTLMHLLSDRDDKTLPKVTDSGFRTKFNSRGEQVYEYPKFKGDMEKWLKSLGFKILPSL